MCNYKRLLVLILVISCSFQLLAQEKDRKYTYSIGANVFKGFIYQHTRSIGHLISDHPTGFEITAYKSTYGNRDWQALYNYPDVGLSIIVIDYHNPLLGKSIGSLIYNDLYLRPHDKLNHLKLRIGGGLAYHTKHYDETENPRNNIVSTPISYSLQIRLEYGVAIKDWKITSGLTWTHFSNAAIKTPNMGVNVPSINLGITRNTSRYKLDYIPTENPSNFDRNLHYNFNVAGGLTYVSMRKDRKFPFLTFSAYVDKRISRRSIVNAGMDLFLNYGLKEKITFDYVTDDLYPDFKRIGLMAGHELYLDRIGILIQLGYYVYRPYESDQIIYQRYGIKYYISDHLYTSLYLKSHAAVAEVAEFTLGFKL